MDKDLEIEKLKSELDALRRENRLLKSGKSAGVDVSRHSDEFWEKVRNACHDNTDYVKSLIRNKSIRMDDMDKDSRTLLILSAQSGSYQLVQLCLNLGADIDHKDKNGNTALSESEIFADIKQLLVFSQMNANLGNRIKETSYIINKQKGFIQNVVQELSKYDSTTKQFFQDTVLDLMTNIIRNKLAFSDDLLALCWQFEIEPLSSNLWSTLKNVCSQIINNGNNLDWFWMKTYIIPSTIWYNCNINAKEEKQNEVDRSYLYYELLKLVQVQSTIELQLLDENLKGDIERDPAAWNKLVQYEVERDYEYDFVRQDIVPNAIKPKYTFQSLIENSSSSAVFNSHRFYDYNQYLSELVLLGNIVDDEFQRSVQNIFNIDKHSNIGYLDIDIDIDEKENREIAKIVGYIRGPVKLLQRARSKAENDYFEQSYPTSACILDINRCALVFNDIRALLLALNVLKNKVKYYQSGNIIGICRSKNRFADYVQERQYADIKLNVLIKGEQNSLIGEIQFLLQTMKDFKSKGHNLYSIQRQEEYMDNSVSNILPTLLDNYKQLWIAANKDDVVGLYGLMVINNQKETDIMAYGVFRESILHTICIKGNEKCFTFLQSVINEALFIDCLLLSNSNNINSIENAVVRGDMGIIEKLFNMTKIKEKYKNDSNLRYRILIWLFAFCHNENVIDYVLSELGITGEEVIHFMGYKYVNNSNSDGIHGNDYSVYRILTQTVHFNQLRILQKLVWIIGDKSFLDNILIADDMNINPLEYAVKMNKLDIIKYIFSFDFVQNKCMENANVLWRIVWWMNHAKVNKATMQYLRNNLKVNESKLKELQSFKYKQADSSVYHKSAVKYQ